MWVVEGHVEIQLHIARAYVCDPSLCGIWCFESNCGRGQREGFWSSVSEIVIAEMVRDCLSVSHEGILIPIVRADVKRQKWPGEHVRVEGHSVRSPFQSC